MAPRWPRPPSRPSIFEATARATGQLADNLEAIVRAGDLVKCQGMLLDTDIVVDELTALDGIGAFQIVFTREPRSDAMDQLVIQFERSENGKTNEATVREIVTRRLREAISLRPEVKSVSCRQLYNHERSIKSKRVLYLRRQPE